MLKKFNVHYWVCSETGRLINSNMQQCRIIDAPNVEDAKKKLKEIELREIKIIGPVVELPNDLVQ